MPSEHELAAALAEAHGVHLPPVPLTTEQLTILRLLSHGGSYASIAKETRSAYERVRGQAQDAQRKLAAKSLPHAVAIAYRFGLID